jgi:eukaryotic-like serine/threonine-protein kinase
MEETQSNRIFADYLIKRKLGAGGMATVYHAVHQQSQQEVALKILHEHYADDPQVNKRLEHEARIVMRLKHPHVVPVLDYGEFDARPYLIMPYFSGGSLAEYFSKPRSIKHETSLRLLTFLASALDYAHSQEVVHRDFKLENILLGANNLPAISDFGIAQSAHTTRITMTGQLLGTPQYIAPESLDSYGELNYKADYYALAVMAYLMFTGYFPYTAEDAISLVLKHRTAIAPLPSLVNPILPSSLDHVLQRGLAKDPEDRYPSAKAFVDALEDAFRYASLVTTKILINALNPLPAKQSINAAGITPKFINPIPAPTELLLPDEIIPAILPAAAPTKKRPFVAYFALLPILLVLGLAFAAVNGIINPTLTEDTTPELTEQNHLFFEARLQSQAIAEATAREESAIEANSIVSATISYTVTSIPSSTPVPSNTARPIPTNTPRPLPSNTPQPQPTNPPATNPPVENPPDSGSNNRGGIIDPILNPVATLVPCVPVPLVRDC